MKIRFVNSGGGADDVGVAEGVTSWVGSVGLAVSDGAEGVADLVGSDGACVGVGADGVVVCVGTGSTVPTPPGMGVL